MSTSIRKKSKAEQILQVVFAGFLTLILSATSLKAALTGKVAGEVIDQSTGEPISGAQIEVIGTPYGAITDEDGEYYILQVPAGSFSIRISALGYDPMIKENVRVLLDLTTPIDFEVMRHTTEITEPIIVTAERPLVQKDLTGTRYIVTAEQMHYLPNSISIADVLLNVSGTVRDSDGSLHVRGGRTGAVSYIYDGVMVTDPVSRELGIRIVPDFLEEINLTSGGFPAEYGEASSGIVNAVTREGQSFFAGSIKAYDGSTQKYDPLTGNIGGVSRSDNQALTANFSGPLDALGLKNATFFIAGEGLRDGGYLPHSFLESRTFTGKVTMRPLANLKVTASGTFFRADQDAYDHRDVNGISYDLNLDGLGKIRRESNVLGFRANYSMNENTIIQANISHFKTQSKLAPTHLFDTYWSDWPGYVEDSTGNYDQANGTLHINNYNFAPELGYTGYTTGDDFNPRYSFRSSSYNSASANITKQLDKRNQIKLGGEVRKYDVSWDEKQFYNSVPFGEKYNFFPSYNFAFAQHKLEYKDIIINAGLRFDYFSSRVSYLVDPLNSFNRTTRESTAKTQLSPRIGVSHPVASNTILRFNYGYFFQPPKTWTLFTNLQGETNSGFPLIGNPDLKPEKTIAYEVGLDHALSSSVTLNVSAYFKDIENLIATRLARRDTSGIPNPNQIVTEFVNEDHSSVKGLDVSLTKRRTNFFTGTMSYSYMQARGNSPAETFAYINVITVNGAKLPVTSYPLDFDQRHTLTINADVRSNPGWKGKLFGIIPASGVWGMNYVLRYGSGLPFSKVDLKTAQRLGGINSFRMPVTYTVDARFNRDFNIGGSKRVLSLFVEVENLFNRRNVVNVYSNTGLPDQDGVNVTDGGLLSAEETSRLHKLISNDPQNYGPPRTIRTGIQFSF